MRGVRSAGLLHLRSAQVFGRCALAAPPRAPGPAVALAAAIIRAPGIAPARCSGPRAGPALAAVSIYCHVISYHHDWRASRVLYLVRLAMGA